MAILKLEICSGTSCHLMGSFDLYRSLDFLPRDYKEYLEIVKVPCLGKCGEGPNIRLGGKTYTHMTPEEIKLVIKREIDKLRGGKDGC